MNITELIEKLKAMPEKMEGYNSEEELVVFNTIGAANALERSLRNCDVGTVDEQLDRYGLFCQNKCPVCENRHSCHICGERYRMKCMVAWAQMPYAEGVSK